MRRHKAGRLICLAVLLPVIAFSAARGVRAEDAKKIDLSATLKYVKDWAAREAFPDSPSFAYQNAYCQFALEGGVNDTDKNRILEFLKKCQKPDGGFVAAPDLDEGSNVIFTYFSLATLDLLDAPSAVDRGKAVDFILSLVQKDAGIKGAAADPAGNLGATSYAVRSLSLLNALDRIDKNRTIAFIKSFRDGNKGFGVRAGLPSNIQSTFLAVEALRLLGGLTDDIKAGVIEYLKETPYSGFKEPENLALMEMDEEAQVLETASILSTVQQLDSEKVYRFVESLYIPDNGGFGPMPGYGTTPPSTYNAVRCLVRLGKLKDPIAVRRP